MHKKKRVTLIPAIIFGCIILSMLVPVRILAQEEFVAPPAQKIASFPFTMLTGGIIIIKATLDYFPDSLNFVLDTGSGGISLDSATCMYFNLPKKQTNRIIRGIAGMKAVEFTYDHVLRLTGLAVDHLDFHINDYDILSSVYGMKIDGIVGYSFLRRFIVTIDYDKMIIDVYTPGLFKYPRGGYLLKPQFNTLPMQAASVKDENKIDTRFYFDTGAGLCLLLSKDIVADSAVLKKKKKFFHTQAEGLGGKAQMDLTVVKEVKVGPYRFRKVPTYIFDDEYNITAYPTLGGLIGNDIFRRFNVVINYPEQQIFIKPNKHFTDSFDYSYTGLGIYMIENKVTVVDIMKNSPAEKSGFHEGDVILGIEGNFTNNIQQYKAMLQNPRSRLNIIIMRNEELVKMSLYVKSIL